MKAKILVDIAGVTFAAVGAWVALKQLELAYRDRMGKDDSPANVDADSASALDGLPYFLSYNVPPPTTGQSALPVNAIQTVQDDFTDNTTWPNFNTGNRL